MREGYQSLDALEVLARLLVVHGVRLRLRADLLARATVVDTHGRDADGPRGVPDRDADVHISGFPVVSILHVFHDEEQRSFDVHGQLPSLHALEQRAHVLLT